MTQGLYWFGLNVPTSSLLLLVLLVPKKVRSRGYKTVERGKGPKSLMEWSKGCQELGRCLVVCVMCCVCSTDPSSVDPFSGEPCPTFYRPRGSTGYRWEKEENTKGIEGPSREPGLPFSLCLPCLTWQTMSEVACSLILVGHALASFSKWVCPILWWRTVRCAGEPSCDSSRSNRGSDHMSVTVDDVSFVLDRSGCRMPVLVSAPQG